MTSKTKMISLLPCPEHHIRGPRETHSSDANPGGSPFPFLKLDIIRHNNMGKHGLDFIRRKEPTWTERGIMLGVVNRLHICKIVNAHHVCRPSPKAKCSPDVETIWCLFIVVSPSLSRSFAKRNPSNFSGFG